MKSSFDSIIQYMPEQIAKALENLNYHIKDKATEIRIRRGYPLVITGPFGSVKPIFNGTFLIISQEIMEEIMLKLTKNSFYSYEEDIKRGFLTLEEGHRVGVAGRMNGGSVFDISSLCIRIASKIEGAADEIYENIIKKTEGSVLIAGPPGSGKTTILRELSEKLGSSVSVIDEREELFGSKSFPLINNGVDVLSGYPKKIGIEIATRCFSPKIIICDEITAEELYNISHSISSGVRIIASAHCLSGEDLIRKGYLKDGLFSYGVVLKNYKISEIIKGEGNEGVGNDFGSCFNNIGGLFSEKETDFKGVRAR